MKTRLFLQCLVAALCLCATVSAQNDQHRPQRDGARGFKPVLNGTWQLCELAPGQDGQLQLKLLPILKIIDSNGTFQQVGIPMEGGCFIEKQGSLEITSDSTFNEKPMSMNPAAQPAEATAVHYRFRGPLWLVINYTDPAKQEKVEELWIRVRPNNHANARPQMREGQSVNMPRRDARRSGGVRPNRTPRNNNAGGYNPFDNNDNNSDDSDDSDFN